MRETAFRANAGLLPLLRFCACLSRVWAADPSVQTVLKSEKKPRVPFVSVYLIRGGVSLELEPQIGGCNLRPVGEFISEGKTYCWAIAIAGSSRM